MFTPTRSRWILLVSLISGGVVLNPTLPTIGALPPGKQVQTVSVRDASVSVPVQEIVRLRDTGLQIDVIRAYIENAKNIQPPTADEIIFLYQRGVAPDLIAAYIQRAGQLREQAGALRQQPPVPQGQQLPVPYTPPPSVSIPMYSASGYPDYGYDDPYYPDYSVGYPYGYPYSNYGYPNYWWNSVYGYPLFYGYTPFGFHDRFDRFDRFNRFGRNSFVGRAGFSPYYNRGVGPGFNGSFNRGYLGVPRGGFGGRGPMSTGSRFVAGPSRVGGVGGGRGFGGGRR